MPRDEAFRAVTLSAAEILGLGNRMGSLDVGKRADVIVTNDDPLQILATVERMWIGGEEVSAEVIDGPRSAVWRQAENRMHSARGAMAWMLGLRDL